MTSRKETFFCVTPWNLICVTSWNLNLFCVTSVTSWNFLCVTSWNLKLNLRDVMKTWNLICVTSWNFFVCRPTECWRMQFLPRQARESIFVFRRLQLNYWESGNICSTSVVFLFVVAPAGLFLNTFYSGDLKFDYMKCGRKHLKSQLFKGRISNGPVFKWWGFSYGYSPNHSKTEPFKIRMFLSRFQMFFWQNSGHMSGFLIVGLPDFRCTFENQTICNPTSFGPVTILAPEFTNPYNLTSHSLILKAA